MEEIRQGKGGDGIQPVINPYTMQLPPELGDISELADSEYTIEGQHGTDLLLLAEFSEIEGPVPLASIPPSGVQGIDLNELPVKLMSTDYQSVGSEFKIMKDIQLMEEVPEKNLYIYAHYFTLYDIRARGFVRPMCLAYISQEKNKLCRFFHKFEEEFTKATEYMKVGNLCFFLRDVEQRMNDLLYTKERFVSACSLFQRDMKDNVGRKHSGRRAKKCHGNLNNLCPAKENILQNATEPHFTSLDDATDNYELAMRYDDTDDRRLYPVTPVSIMPQCSLLNYPSKNLINCKEEINGNDTTINCDNAAMSPTFEDPFCVKVSSLMFDESFDVERICKSEEASILQHTSLDALLAQFKNCQTILNVVNAYLEHSKTEVELQHHLIDLKSTNECPLFGVKDISFEYVTKNSSDDIPSLFVMALMRRNFKKLRSIKALCGIGYVVSIAKLLHVYKIYSQPFANLLFSGMDTDIVSCPMDSLFIGIIPVVNVVGTSYEEGNCLSKDFDFGDYFLNQELMQLLTTEFSQKLTPDSDYKDASETIENIRMSEDYLGQVDVEDNSCSHADGSTEKDSTVSKGDCQLFKHEGIHYLGIPTKNSWSGESLEIMASFTAKDGGIDHVSRELEEGSVEDFACESDNVESYAMYFNIFSRMAKSRLSTLMQQFRGVSQCIIHSLLSGRPLIVAGPECLKSVVVFHCRALSSILPRIHGEPLPILRWHSGTVTLHHMRRYRIIGLCIPERLHVQDLMCNTTLNQLTVLNVENGHIYGVAYSGTLLRSIHQLRLRSFQSDDALQTLVQSTVVNLGLKVFLLYHLIRTTKRSAYGILKAIGISSGDRDMILFLALPSMG